MFFFLIETHFACLQTVFNYFWSFSVFLLLHFPTSFSYFFLMWGQFDVYWLILEAGGFCPFMPIFIVGGGANVRWGPTLAFQGVGWTGGSFLLSPIPFLIYHTPLLLSPTPCFISPSLALLSPSNLLLSPSPSLLSPIHSLLSPTSLLFSPTPVLPCSPFGYGTIRTKTSSSWNDSHKW